jgi:ankyrin repeat protein
MKEPVAATSEARTYLRKLSNRSPTSYLRGQQARLVEIEDAACLIESSAAYSDVERTSSLLEGCASQDWRGGSSSGCTPLHAAAAEGNRRAVEALLEAGADVKAADGDMCTALHLAARRGNVAVIEALVAARANVNAADYAGWTPIMHAAGSTGCAAAVRALIQAGARVNAAAEGGWTPIHAASRAGNASIIEELVQAGAHVDGTDEYGQSPLHCAASLGHAAAIQALLAAAADCGLRTAAFGDRLGCTALELAEKHDPSSHATELLRRAEVRAGA